MNKTGSKEQQRQRLAAKLRENLKRRKQQGRERAKPATTEKAEGGKRGVNEGD